MQKESEENGFKIKIEGFSYEEVDILDFFIKKGKKWETTGLLDIEIKWEGTSGTEKRCTTQV